MQIDFRFVILARGEWPDSLDTTLIVLSAVLVIVMPAIGYWLMVIDIRAYFRSLRRALLVVKNHFTHIPDWAKQETPSCLRALGLKLPCNEEDVKRAYRKRAEALHPDRGGDPQQFQLLQHHFEDAIRFLSD